MFGYSLNVPTNTKEKKVKGTIYKHCSSSLAFSHVLTTGTTNKNFEKVKIDCRYSIVTVNIT